MTKHYRIVKDHPLWETGAIISNKQDEKQYLPISDIWNRELVGYDSDSGFYESASLVEHQPEWFQRVYEVSILGKARYLSKEAARKAHDELYKEK